jgi:hypothetical protein
MPASSVSGSMPTDADCPPCRACRSAASVRSRELTLGHAELAGPDCRCCGYPSRTRKCHLGRCPKPCQWESRETGGPGSTDAIAATLAQVGELGKRSVVLIIRRSWVRSPPAQLRVHAREVRVYGPSSGCDGGPLLPTRPMSQRTSPTSRGESRMSSSPSRYSTSAANWGPAECPCRTSHRASAYGVMFWFMWKRFPGS